MISQLAKSPRWLTRSGVFGFAIAVLIFSSLIPQASVADSGWRFFPTKTPVQSELLKMIKDGNSKQALLFWSTSLHGEAFVDGTTGKALFNYLLWKSGAPVTAAERLFSLRSPQNLHPTVLRLWKSELSLQPKPVQKAKVNFSWRWKKALGPQLVSRLRPPSVFALHAKKTLSVLKTKLKSKALIPEQRNWLNFQLGLAAAIQDQNTLAYNQFARLLESEQKTVGSDQLFMALARLAYQREEYQAAVDWYSKVPKKSALWLASREESAWAHIRLNQPNQAVAFLETATSPVFAALSGPESDFLDSFVSLMICDYPRVFRNTGQFAKKHKVKIQGLELLASKKKSALHSSILEVVDKRPLRLASFSKIVRSLPRDFLLDEFLIRHMNYRAALSQESARLSRLTNGHIQLGGFSSDPTSRTLEAVAASSKSKARRTGTDIADRLAGLAQEELKEYKLMIQKLHIVEAEVIQRLHLDENLKGRRAQRNNPVPKSSDVMSFPVTKEVWLDELDSYHAEVKDCPKLERASL